jgi:hypothetical protein
MRFAAEFRSACAESTIMSSSAKYYTTVSKFGVRTNALPALRPECSKGILSNACVVKNFRQKKGARRREPDENEERRIGL